MAIFDKLRKIRGERKKEKGEKKAEPKMAKKKNLPHIAYKVLISPHVTEKAVKLNSQGQYIFKVRPNVNKIEVKRAIEEVYRVEVESVRTINIHRKQRRFGGRIGWRKGSKKAIIRLKKGQKIDLGIS